MSVPLLDAVRITALSMDLLLIVAALRVAWWRIADPKTPGIDVIPPMLLVSYSLFVLLHMGTEYQALGTPATWRLPVAVGAVMLGLVVLRPLMQLRVPHVIAMILDWRARGSAPSHS